MSWGHTGAGWVHVMGAHRCRVGACHDRHASSTKVIELVLKQCLKHKTQLINQ